MTRHSTTSRPPRCSDPLSPQTPRMARRPSSMSSIKTSGNRPARSPSSDRSISSRPSGTATESLGSPLAVAGRSTFPAIPARATFEVTGTTWVCQTSTLSTSSEDTTTHGRLLSSSIQCTAPLATTVQNAPSDPALPTIPRQSGVRNPPVGHQPTAAGRASDRSAWRRGGEADRQPMSRTAHRGCR